MYTLLGAISALFTEQTNPKSSILRLSNLLIWSIKIVDPTIVRVEILEHWQWLEVYGIPLKKYIGERKIELPKREVELLMDI